MSELRFDGRVAVVTGSGRGLGRAYAMLLAARGARLVINDLGGSLGGDGADAGPAEAVAAEIRALGGEAIASTDSVATPQGGQAIIDKAIGQWGRVDILVHNAGNTRRALLKDMSVEDFESILSVHLRGGFHVLRAALPFMCEAGYGRVVMASSVNGIYANATVGHYSAAKAGLIGLSNTAAIEGASFGVKSNVIIPAAVTRMAEGLDVSQYPPMDPDLVAPAVAWLAHESCDVSGEAYISVAGRMARAFVLETAGVYRPSWTIEDMAANMAEIRKAEQIAALDRSGDFWFFPPAPSGHLDHLRRSFARAREG